MAQYKKDEIKKRIIEVALEMFFIKGYRETKIKNIADQADISVGNIYRYFSSKEKILEEILDENFKFELKEILEKRTIILTKEYLNVVSDIEIKWYEEEYFDYLIKNRKKLIIGFHSRHDRLNIDDILKHLINIKCNILVNYYEKVNVLEITNTLIMVIKSNMSMVIDVLSSHDLHDVKEMLKNIDIYHFSGVTGLWDSLLKPK